MKNIMVEGSKLNLNKFLNGIKLKKQYIEKLKNKISALNGVSKVNPKDLESVVATKSHSSIKSDYLVMYIIDISFSETNTLLHVTDFAGNLEFFCSAGSLNYKGKQKKLRFFVFRDLFRILVSKLTFLKGKPVALHLKNVGSNKFWIIKKLKTKFFIKVVRNYNLYPFNGCRKKKMRRKKFKKEEMAERFKAADCKSVGFPIVGSNPTFFKYKTTTEYNAAVACLLWEQEGMCSNHIIPKIFTYFKLWYNFKFVIPNWYISNLFSQ